MDAKISKHTAGTWTAHIATPVYHSGQHHIIVSVNDAQKLVARATGDSQEEAEANARLIAAAPELLAALKDTLAIAQIKWGNLDPDANKVMTSARAAIAKATGQ